MKRIVPIFLGLPLIILASCGTEVDKKVAPEKKPMVLIKTSKGDMKVELYQDKAPITVENFLKYVDGNHYDGTIFHRVIPTFMIQGGGFEPVMEDGELVGIKERGNTRPPIKNESDNGLENVRGTLAMARKLNPHSATDQFFINTEIHNAFLDKANAPDGFGYAVFGKVIEGLRVIDKIKVVPTGTISGHEKVPLEPVMIHSITRVEKKNSEK